MSDNQNQNKSSPLEDIEHTKLALREKIQVRPDGKIQIKIEDMPELFQNYVTDVWVPQIMSLGLSGNRQSLRAKSELYKNYLSIQDPKLKNKGNFAKIAKRMGYRIEAIDELWADLNDIYQVDFFEYLKNKVSPPKKENNGGDYLVF